MTFALCFWIVMLFWLIDGFWRSGGNWKGQLPNVLLFLLLALLGWAVFGPALHR